MATLHGHVPPPIETEELKDTKPTFLSFHWNWRKNSDGVFLSTVGQMTASEL